MKLYQNLSTVLIVISLVTVCIAGRFEQGALEDEGGEFEVEQQQQSSATGIGSNLAGAGSLGSVGAIQQQQQQQQASIGSLGGRFGGLSGVGQAQQQQQQQASIGSLGGRFGGLSGAGQAQQQQSAIIAGSQAGGGLGGLVGGLGNLKGLTGGLGNLGGLKGLGGLGGLGNLAGGFGLGSGDAYTNSVGTGVASTSITSQESSLKEIEKGEKKSSYESFNTGFGTGFGLTKGKLGEWSKLIFQPFELVKSIAATFKLDTDKFIVKIGDSLVFGSEAILTPFVSSLRIIESVFVPDECSLRLFCGIGKQFSFMKSTAIRYSSFMDSSISIRAFREGIVGVDCDLSYLACEPTLKKGFLGLGSVGARSIQDVGSKKPVTLAKATNQVKDGNASSGEKTQGKALA